MMHGEEAGLGAQGRPLLKLNKLAAPSFGQATPRIILAILQASGRRRSDPKGRLPNAGMEGQ
jgi:hypothetical protein